MEKIRFTYSKSKLALYLTNDDLIRLFEKTFKKAKIEIEVNRSLFSEINEYARFAKIPGRVLKEKRERLVVAMIEKILADDVAFAEFKAEQKKEKAAKRKESKENVKQLKKELIAPRWIGKKLDCLNKIDKELLRRNSFQSDKFGL